IERRTLAMTRRENGDRGRQPVPCAGRAEETGDPARGRDGLRRRHRIGNREGILRECERSGESECGADEGERRQTGSAWQGHGGLREVRTCGRGEGWPGGRILRGISRSGHEKGFVIVENY